MCTRIISRKTLKPFFVVYVRIVKRHVEFDLFPLKDFDLTFCDGTSNVCLQCNRQVVFFFRYYDEPKLRHSVNMSVGNTNGKFKKTKILLKGTSTGYKCLRFYFKFTKIGAVLVRFNSRRKYAINSNNINAKRI